MINAEKLKQAEIDYDAGMERFMQDTALYEAVLCAFISDNLLLRAQAAFTSGDTSLLFKIIHEAKGASGNAGLTVLYTTASALVALLRTDSYTKEELTASYRAFEATYERTFKAIQSALQ